MLSDGCSAIRPVVWVHASDGILHRGFMQYELSDDHKAILIPPSKIFYDESFNCRQPFTEQSVLELSKDIESAGRLLFPLVVQPAKDVLNGIPDGYEFRLIAGFRRFYATTKILKWSEVPCMVIEGLSEQEARRVNYKENVERQQLTFLEEARGMQRLYPPGTKPDFIARDLHRTQGWVKVRLAVLKMPEQIQQDVNNGRLTQYDIAKLARLPPDGQLEALQTLYAEQERTTKRVTFKTLEAHRRRSVAEIRVKIVQLAERLGDGIWCDALRWAGGIITPADLDRAVDEWDKLTDSDLDDT